MSIETLPFISVQADWNDVVREVGSSTIESGSFWIACYLTGRESVQGSVEVTRGEDSEVKLEGKDGISVSSINSRSFKVDCGELNVKDIVVYSPKKELEPAKDKSVSCLDISPNGNLFAAGNGSEVSVGNVASGESQLTLKGHLSDVTTVQFFPSNLVLLTGGADFQLKIWSVLNGSNPVTLKGHTSAITSTAIISQGRNVLSSSRDGAVKLWNCGTSSTIATVCSYSTPVNKMLLTKLPPKYESAPAGTLDPLEVDTADKLVLVGLDDGTVRGIHLGSKKELFSTIASEDAITSLVYEPETNTLITGSKNGVVAVYSITDSLEKPITRWKRNGFTVTSLAIPIDSNGDTVVCVGNADGSIYQTSALNRILETKSVTLEAEYTGNELETVYDMKTFSTNTEANAQRIACIVRDGKIKIY